MNELIYKPKFYGGHATGSNLSARLVLPEVFATIGLPGSIIDVGCGIATWGGAARDLGVGDYLGIDGNWVPREQLRVPIEQFLPTDLSQLAQLQVTRRFDLAICIEVAEHLPETLATTLVRFLTAHADYVLFGAAIPGQGGTHHINERWQSYWGNIFLACDFDAFDVIRPRIAGNQQVEYWYRQNTVLYVKRGSEFAAQSPIPAVAPPALDYVLPELYESKLQRIEKPKLRELLRKIPTAFMSDLRRKFLRPHSNR